MGIQHPNRSDRASTPQESVMGHHIEGPRLTRAGALLLAWTIGVPVLVLGLLADIAVQWLFGWCVGLWCLL